MITGRMRYKGSAGNWRLLKNVGVSRELTGLTYLVIYLPTGISYNHTTNAYHNAFICDDKSNTSIDNKNDIKNIAILSKEVNSDGGIIEAEADANQEAKVILISDNPLNVPITQYYPFVMNSQHQIMQAGRYRLLE